ncbi:MAG: DegV family protein, partial [Bacilli bacterium]
MKCKIVADSSCDLTKDMIEEMGVELVPLSLQLGDTIYVD